MQKETSITKISRVQITYKSQNDLEPTLFSHFSLVKKIRKFIS